MSPNEAVVIIGGGQAGVEAAIALRHLGWPGDVVIVDAEAELPYERPPLSKTLLLAKTDPSRIRLRPAELYEQLRIKRMTGSAVFLDVEHQHVALSDGMILTYQALILATGAAPKRLQVPGSSLPNVLTLRSLSNSLTLRSSLTPGARLAVVGGGFLGLEVAAAAAQLGVHVTVIEAGNRLLQRSGSKMLGDVLTDRLQQAGITVALNESVTRFLGDTSVEAAETTKGRIIHADVALVAIGAAPNGELVREAGMSSSEGIRVDAHARTAVSNIYAVGDCANFLDVRFGRHARLESVQSATWQARVAAAGIMSAPPPSPKHAYFWSSLFELKIQIAGLADPSIPSRDKLVGNKAGGFAIYRFQHDRLAAVECINSPADYVKAQLLIGQQQEERAV